MSKITVLGEAIIEELRAINARLDALERHRSTPEHVWLTPAQMAEALRVSPRTLQNYVASGRLSLSSYKKEPRGAGFVYRYHRELVMRDLGLS